VAAEPACGWGEGRREDLLFQARPGEAVERRDAILQRDDLAIQAIQLFAGALAGQGCGRREVQAMQFLGVDDGEAHQDAGINAVTLGVTLVVAPQVSDFLAVDEIDWDPVPSKEHGDRKPGHRGGLEHDLQWHVGCPIPSAHEEAFEVGWGGVEGEDRRKAAALCIGDHRLMGAGQGQINPDGPHIPSLRGASVHAVCEGTSDGNPPRATHDSTALPKLAIDAGPDPMTSPNVLNRVRAPGREDSILPSGAAALPSQLTAIIGPPRCQCTRLARL